MAEQAQPEWPKTPPDADTLWQWAEEAGLDAEAIHAEGKTEASR